MQVLAHVRDVVGLRLVAVGGVLGELGGQEVAEHPLAGRGAALEQQHRPDAAVQGQLREQGVHVGQVLARDVDLPLGLQLGPRQVDQEPRQVPGDLGSERPGGVLLLVRGELDRHHHVALDLDDGAVQRRSDALAPAPLRPQVAAVADHQGGVLPQPDGHLVRGAALQHERDPPALQRGRDVGQAVDHEVVVPEVGLRVVVHQPEGHQQGQPQLVGPVHGVLERVVELGPLRLLHPVEDVAALIPDGGLVQVLHPLRLDAGVEVVGSCGSGAWRRPGRRHAHSVEGCTDSVRGPMQNKCAQFLCTAAGRA